eukprot:1252194-Amorphochlora_amoeboformis.AAC.1
MRVRYGSTQRCEDPLWVDTEPDRPDEISGDVFDMLMSMGDFEEFRGLMLAHKAARGKKGLEIKSSLSLKVSA